MKKYWYIIRNSFFEVNHSWFVMLMQIVRPFLAMYGFILFYSFVLSPSAQGITLSKEITIYFLFVLTAGAIELPGFSEDIHKEIKNEAYLNIDKLPISPTVYYIVKSFAGNSITVIVFAIFSICYMIFNKMPLISIITFLPTVILGTILSHLIFFTFTCLNFYSETADIWLFRAIFDFTSGRWIPIAYAPPFIQAVLYVLPFPYAFGALAKNFSKFQPVEVLTSIGISVGWCVALIIISTYLWRKGSYYFQENG